MSVQILVEKLPVGCLEADEEQRRLSATGAAPSINERRARKRREARTRRCGERLPVDEPDADAVEARGGEIVAVEPVGLRLPR